MSQLRSLLCHKFLSYGVLGRLPFSKFLTNSIYRVLRSQTGKPQAQLFVLNRGIHSLCTMCTTWAELTLSEESWRAGGCQNWHICRKRKHVDKNAVQNHTAQKKGKKFIISVQTSLISKKLTMHWRREAFSQK